MSGNDCSFLAIARGRTRLEIRNGSRDYAQHTAVLIRQSTVRMQIQAASTPAGKSYPPILQSIGSSLRCPWLTTGVNLKPKTILGLATIMAYSRLSRRLDMAIG